MSLIYQIYFNTGLMFSSCKRSYYTCVELKKNLSLLHKTYKKKICGKQLFQIKIAGIEELYFFFLMPYLTVRAKIEFENFLQYLIN